MYIGSSVRFAYTWRQNPWNIPNAAESSLLLHNPPVAIEANEPLVIMSPIKDIVNHFVEVADVNGVIQRIDVNAVVERIDVNTLVQRTDVNELLSRVDWCGSPIVTSKYKYIDCSIFGERNVLLFGCHAIATFHDGFISEDCCALSVVERKTPPTGLSTTETGSSSLENCIHKDEATRLSINCEIVA